MYPISKIFFLFFLIGSPFSLADDLIEEDTKETTETFTSEELDFLIEKKKEIPIVIVEKFTQEEGPPQIFINVFNKDGMDFAIQLDSEEYVNSMVTFFRSSEFSNMTFPLKPEDKKVLLEKMQKNKSKYKKDLLMNSIEGFGDNFKTAEEIEIEQLEAEEAEELEKIENDQTLTEEEKYKSRTEIYEKKLDRYLSKKKHYSFFGLDEVVFKFYIFGLMSMKVEELYHEDVSLDYKILVRTDGKILYRLKTVYKNTKGKFKILDGKIKLIDQINFKINQHKDEIEYIIEFEYSF